jgi:hypothetical protein
MLLHLLVYLPFIGFMYMGLSRLAKYNDRSQLWPVAVGVFGVIVLLNSDYGASIFNLSGVQIAVFYRISEVLDVLGAASVVAIVIWEWTRK